MLTVVDNYLLLQHSASCLYFWYVEQDVVLKRPICTQKLLKAFILMGLLDIVMVSFTMDG